MDPQVALHPHIQVYSKVGQLQRPVAVGADGRHVTLDNSKTCRVCGEAELVTFGVFDRRRYERCPLCFATLLAPEHFLDRESEREHYLKHQNDIQDPGYRRFASKLVEPLASRIHEGAVRLDYGCGTGPVAAAMLEERGMTVELFDPFFQPNEAALQGTYDFIVCSEVAEHFHQPAEEFDKLARLLRSGGVFGVMTCFQTDDARFADWHYRRDPTHVAFYREATFQRIAKQRDLRCEFPVKDVALFTAS